MNAAARVVSETGKFDHGLTQILHDDLHWLSVADRVTITWCHHAQMSAWQGSSVPYRLLHTGQRCCWQAASQVGHTVKLMMVVPRHRLSTVGCRTFTMQGPMVWNSLPDDLRAQQDYESFRQCLKTWLFSSYTSVLSALETS